MSEADLVAQLESLREQQRAVDEVLRALASFEGLQPVLDAVVAAANRLCNGVSAGLWLTDGDLFRVAALIATPEQTEYERAHPHVPEAHSLTGRVLATRRPVHIPDVLADPMYEWGSQPVAGYRAMVGVPIFADEQLIGVLAVTRPVPEPFADDEIRLVTTFANQASIAIANARLLDAGERQLEQQRAISDVLRAVARSEGLEPVFGSVVDAATRLCHGDYGAMYLVDGDVLRVVTQHSGHHGPQELYAYEREHPHARDRSTVIGRVALTRDVVHIPDTREDPEYVWAGEEITEYRALLGVPIFVDGELIGAMNVVRIAPEPFLDEHIELVKTFADQAAIAIANARLLDRIERQRTELARFVSPQVAMLLSSDDGERLLGGHRAYISVLFCDLRGFTAFTETAAPEELFELLRAYHALVGELIAEHHGTLEHFAGDGVMVFFNDPAPVDEHELQAIRMALALQERFAELAVLWRKRGTELGLGIGMASGYATLGRIGFDGRYDYGALGPVTNLASRLSTRAEGGQSLISQRLHATVEETVDAVPVGDVELKGFARPVAAYEVRALRAS